MCPQMLALFLELTPIFGAHFDPDSGTRGCDRLLEQTLLEYCQPPMLACPHFPPPPLISPLALTLAFQGTGLSSSNLEAFYFFHLPNHPG